MESGSASKRSGSATLLSRNPLPFFSLPLLLKDFIRWPSKKPQRTAKNYNSDFAVCKLTLRCDAYRGIKHLSQCKTAFVKRPRWGWFLKKKLVERPTWGRFIKKSQCTGLPLSENPFLSDFHKSRMRFIVGSLDSSPPAASRARRSKKRPPMAGLFCSITVIN